MILEFATDSLFFILSQAEFLKEKEKNDLKKQKKELKLSAWFRKFLACNLIICLIYSVSGIRLTTEHHNIGMVLAVDGIFDKVLGRKMGIQANF